MMTRRLLLPALMGVLCGCLTADAEMVDRPRFAADGTFMGYVGMSFDVTDSRAGRSTTSGFTTNR